MKKLNTLKGGLGIAFLVTMMIPLDIFADPNPKYMNIVEMWTIGEGLNLRYGFIINVVMVVFLLSIMKKGQLFIHQSRQVNLFVFSIIALLMLMMLVVDLCDEYKRTIITNTIGNPDPITTFFSYYINIFLVIGMAIVKFKELESQ